MYTIYMHRNKMNGKIYIGQTCQEPIEKRWGKDGKNYKGCPYFYSAIQKYGWNNFEHIILEQNLTKEQANEREKFYIKNLDTCNRKFGYNIKIGGNNLDFETVKIIHNKRWSKQEQREQQSQKMKIWYKNLSMADFQILQAKKKGINHKNSKKVVCQETQEVFSCLREAAEWAGLGKAQGGNISEQIAGRRKSAGKHPETNQPLHWYFYGDKPHLIQETKKKGKKVQNIETKQVFNSMVEAGLWCGVKNNRICESCKSNGIKGAGKIPGTEQKAHWIYYI